MNSRSCTLPTCGRMHYGRGYCRRHWARWRRHGDPLAGGRTRRSCRVPGCDGVHHGHGFCRTHWSRLRRHGDPGTELPVASRDGHASSYGSVHRQLRAARGAPDGHACAVCGEAAEVWSYDGTDPDALLDPARKCRYSLDLRRYRPACRSCHRRAHSGPLDVDRAMRLYAAGASSRGIAALLHVSANTVLRALRSRDVPIRPRGRTR